MNIDTAEFIITENLSFSHQEQLLALYHQMWWADKRTSEEINEVIENSSFIVCVIDNTKNAVVGFARILTDYFTLAYVFDVIVCESYRGKNLGKVIMNYIIDHEKLKNIMHITLACKKDMIPFYQQFGFLENDEHTVVMRRRNPVIV